MALILPTAPPPVRLPTCPGGSPRPHPLASPPARLPVCPPPRLRATPGAIDVWRVDLGAADDARAAGLLDAAERARGARIAVERRRVLWVRSRAALRALLGRYLERDPRALRFALGAHGKPRVCDGGDLRFSLSHSGELALIAVTAGREVGVDIERARARYTREFLRAWTMREATVKCLATGLAQPSEPSKLWMTELKVGPHAAAALATALATAGGGSTPAVHERQLRGHLG